eukprot:Gb_00632 [translate_table: standard]
MQFLEGLIRLLGLRIALPMGTSSCPLQASFQHVIEKTQAYKILLIPRLVHHTNLVKEIIHVMEVDGFYIEHNSIKLDVDLVEKLCEIPNVGAPINLDHKQRWFEKKKNDMALEVLIEALSTVNDLAFVKVDLAVSDRAYKTLSINILTLTRASDINKFPIKWVRIIYDIIQHNKMYNFVAYFIHRIMATIMSVKTDHVRLFCHALVLLAMTLLNYPLPNGLVGQNKGG